MARKSAPARVTDEQAEVIREGHAAGRSQSSIAAELGIDRPTISRWSKRAGLLWTGRPAAAEQQAERVKYARQALAEGLLVDALDLRERLYPEDDQLDARTLKELAGGIERLLRAHQHLAEATDILSADAQISMLGRLQAQLKAAVVGRDAK